MVDEAISTGPIRQSRIENVTHVHARRSERKQSDVRSVHLLFLDIEAEGVVNVAEADDDRRLTDGGRHIDGLRHPFFQEGGIGPLLRRHHDGIGDLQRIEGRNRACRRRNRFP